MRQIFYRSYYQRTSGWFVLIGRQRYPITRLLRQLSLPHLLHLPVPTHPRLPVCCYYTCLRAAATHPAVTGGPPLPPLALGPVPANESAGFICLIIHTFRSIF
jgi:hypothetical protein